MIHQGDCVEVMAAMDAESIDAIVTDPPYGLEFMGKEWDRLKPDVRSDRGGAQAPGRAHRDAKKLAPVAYGGAPRRSTYTCDACGKRDKFKNDHGCGAAWSSLRLPDDHAAYGRTMQQWHTRWATEALRVAKPGAYLLAFGGTRTVHRLTVALEDAGWIIRDLLVWGYASGFPKSKASLKPAWEPIVLARKPGLLAKLRIDECRIGTADGHGGGAKATSGFANGYERGDGFTPSDSGRWPANIVLTDPIFDGGWEGVEGGGDTGRSAGGNASHIDGSGIYGQFGGGLDGRDPGYGDTGTYSRFFIIPKASRKDREPDVPGLPSTLDGGVWGGDEDDLSDGKKRTIARQNVHPTVKPTALMRHLIRLVTPEGGTVLDPFLGSGTTAKAAVLEGVQWVGIEREPEYIRIAEQRLVGLEPEPEQLKVPA